MPQALTFYPPRRRGLILFSLLLIPLLLLTVATLLQAMRTAVGPTFLVNMLVFVLSAAVTPWLLYQIYALLRSSYTLEREGIHIQWGLRVEDIPMPDVLWVRHAADLGRPLPLPFWRLPGAIRGAREVPELGWVEFLASDPRRLLLIATPGGVHAISPEDPDAFLEAFRALIEMGSFSPLAPVSIMPTSVVRQVWADHAARYLTLIGLGASLALVAWVILLIRSQTQIRMGFISGEIPRRPGPTVRLTLFPAINAFFYLTDFALGVVFYRQPSTRPLAYILWAAGLLTAGLFLLALYLILRIQ